MDALHDKFKKHNKKNATQREKDLYCYRSYIYKLFSLLARFIKYLISESDLGYRLGLGPSKTKRTFDYSQKLIETPSGDFN